MCRAGGLWRAAVYVEPCTKIKMEIPERTEQRRALAGRRRDVVCWIAASFVSYEQNAGAGRDDRADFRSKQRKPICEGNPDA